MIASAGLAFQSAPANAWMVWAYNGTCWSTYNSAGYDCVIWWHWWGYQLPVGGNTGNGGVGNSGVQTGPVQMIHNNGNGTATIRTRSGQVANVTIVARKPS